MTQALAVNDYQSTELILPDRATLVAKLQAVKEFQQLCHELLSEGDDYGVIPGTNKPTLFKPGAEKITKILGLAERYEIVQSVEDWTRPLFRYLIKCQLLFNGTVVAESYGECNSMEDKYRWRNAQRKCPTCGNESIIKGKEEFGGGWLCWKNKGGCGAKFSDNDYEITGQEAGKVENPDIFSLVNTILKMGQKRAFVGAALSAGRLSEVFTQDLDDMPRGDDAPVAPQATTRPPQRQQPARAAQPDKSPTRPQGQAVAITPELQEQADRFGWGQGALVKWLSEKGHMEGSVIKDTAVDALKDFADEVGV